MHARQMRRARLDWRHIGRKPLDLNREVILGDRQHGQSLGQLAKTYCASRAQSTATILSSDEKPEISRLPSPLAVPMSSMSFATHDCCSLISER